MTDQDCGHRYRRLEGNPLLTIFGCRTHASGKCQEKRHVHMSRLSMASLSLVTWRM